MAREFIPIEKAAAVRQYPAAWTTLERKCVMIEFITDYAAFTSRTSLGERIAGDVIEAVSRGWIGADPAGDDWARYISESLDSALVYTRDIVEWWLEVGNPEPSDMTVCDYGGLIDGMRLALGEYYQFGEGFTEIVERVEDERDAADDFED